MKSVLDRSFQYTPAFETDLKKTFARVRRQLKEEQKERMLAYHHHFSSLLFFRENP